MKMRFQHVCIEAFGYALPKESYSSLVIEEQLAPLYQRLGLTPGRLEQLTGVAERRLWPLGTRPSSVAAEAAEDLFSRQNLTAAELQQFKGEIDLLIFTGVCRDALEPATASVVHHRLGLAPSCMVLDLSNACLGFLNAMTLASSLIERGDAKRALIVSGENAAPLYEHTLRELKDSNSEELFRQRLVNLTLGSAAVACTLVHSSSVTAPEVSSRRLLGGLAQADSSAHGLCVGQGDLQYQSMETHTAELLREGLKLAQHSWKLFLEHLGWQKHTAEHIFTHQVSRSHQEKLLSLLGINTLKHSTQIPTLGNTGSVAAPLSLFLAAEQGQLKPGDKFALLGIGSGLNTLMLGGAW